MSLSRSIRTYTYAARQRRERAIAPDNIIVVHHKDPNTVLSLRRLYGAAAVP